MIWRKQPHLAIKEKENNTNLHADLKVFVIYKNDSWRDAPGRRGGMNDDRYRFFFHPRWPSDL